MQHMADDNGSAEWTVEGHSIRISYTPAVMESMRQAAWEGLQKVPRRGLEIGGVLFGLRDREQIHIREWRPMACEHAKGPGFELSPRDEEQLTRLLETARNDVDLRELEPLGWFHSHTRDNVKLTTADLDIYDRFFPGPWQVSLVLRPHMYEPTRAGFFFRQADGSIQSESSYSEFVLEAPRKRVGYELDSRSMPPSAPTREESHRRFSRLTQQIEEAPALEPAEPAHEEHGFLWKSTRAISERSRVFYGVAAVLVLAAPFLGLPMLTPAQEEPIAFAVREMDGHLLVEWNKRAAPVLEADGGTIWITDGPISRQISLTPDELRASSLSYIRQTGEVRFRLTLDKNGQVHTEHADYTGELPAAPVSAAVDGHHRPEPTGSRDSAAAC